MVKSGKATSSPASGHSGFQTELITKAMAEAAKLFGQSGGAASGNKQDAVNGAAMTAMKLFVQSNKSGGLTGLINKASSFPNVAVLSGLVDHICRFLVHVISYHTERGCFTKDVLS